MERREKKGTDDRRENECSVILTLASSRSSSASSGTSLARPEKRADVLNRFLN